MAPVARVAVVIPCYKQAHFLGDAIESTLKQTLPPSEIVVIDDGSPDDVRGVVARFPGVRYIRQRNQGLSAARNTGIRATTSELLVFLDSDDRLLPRAVERGVTHHSRHPGCGFVAGRMHTIAADGSLLRGWQPYPVTSDDFAQLLINHCGIYPLTVMYRRSAIEAMGSGFDTSLRSAEDWDMDIRLAQRFPFYLYNEPIAEYRKHGNNMTRNAAVMMMSILRVLQRQRGFTRRKPYLEPARRQGLARVHGYFTEQVITQIHDDVAAHRWRGALAKCWILLRWHPHVVVERLALKWEKMVSPRHAHDGRALPRRMSHSAR
ncbi:MAG TPA: glycosyltransferase [Gemmatimonadaceae bacterium]|nr:glycosyltransferase [Gemmatimonadaceae bacterium]